MSFTQFPSVKKKHSKRVKSTSARRSQWDDTTSDLSAYKATPEDLKLRKLLATSKNIDAVRQELEEKRLKAVRQQHQTLRNSADRKGRGYAFCSGLDSASKAVARELIYDNEQYMSLLSKTDQALTIARDVLGEDGKRMQAHPAVTPAPGFDESSERPDGTILTHPVPPTKLEVLNNTVMQQTALNDTDVNGEDECYEKGDRNGSFESFENGFTDSEAARFAPRDPSTPDSSGKLFTKGCGSTPNGRARRSSKRDQLSDITSDTHRPTACESDDVKQMLQSVEKELADLSAHVGTRSLNSQQLRPGTFAGYTATMVNVNSELVFCMKHVNMKLQAEVTARERLEAEVSSQRKLIDGLTEDLLDVQEKLAQALSALHEFRELTCATPAATSSSTSAAATVNERPKVDVTSRRSRDLADERETAATAVEQADRKHVALGIDPMSCRPPSDSTFPLQLSQTAAELQPGQRLPSDIFAQLPTSENLSERAAFDGFPAMEGFQPSSVDQPRQVLQAWPSDVGNKEPSANSSSTLKSSMAVLQKQIDLLNKEHTQAVSRFKQLQQLQENLTVTKASATESS